MIIYDNNNQVLLDIPVDDDSYRYRALMQGKKVYLHYSLPRHVELPVGSYIEYQGERYTLWYPENFRKKGSRAFEYTVELGGNEEILKKYKFKLLSQRPPKLRFPFTATPALFLRLLVDNLNRFDSGWTVGACLEATEKALSFNHESCFDVLSRLASEFHTEWEIAGKTIHLCKVEKYKDNPVALSYGRGNGFVPGVGRANRGDKQPVTVLYVQGGEQNIAPSTYGSPSLLLPRSAELVYEGRRYQTDADGLYITRADLPLSVHTEDSFDASHIYPSRVGEVTAVQTEAGEDSEGQPVTFYNIVDTTIPDALDYRACRLPGEKATLIFQSGLLSGREFDLVQSEKELSGYDPATKTFRLVSLPEGDGWLPNERLCPAPGDKYAIFHIALPQSYICDDATRTGASWDMFREAVRYFYENEQPQFTFSGELDGIWAKRHWLEIGGRLVPGGYVNFSDTQFQPEGIAIRITGVTDYLNKPHSPRIELSNTPVAGFASDQLGKIEAEEVTNRQLHLDALSYTKRRFRDLEETGKMLEAAIEGFSSPIDPLSVVTMSLQVGSEALQFRFVGSKTDPTTVEPALRYDQRTKVFTAAAAILQHLTLGIQEIAPAHDPSAHRYWDLAGYTSPPLDDPAGLYLYAKCSRDGTAGSFELSKTPFPLEKEGFYYFLVGTLSSESGGGRSFVTVYGFTEVLPGRITTDRIVSADGRSYFNLQTGEIGGRITFTSGSSGLDNVAEWPAARQDIARAKQAGTDALSRAEQASSTAGNASRTASDALLTANSKAKVFYAVAPPSLGMKTSDLWVDGTRIYRYTGSAWVPACDYDNTKTTISGGLITTGAVVFGNSGGMTGSGSIRIWSGGTCTDKGQPPSTPTFYVESNGNIVSGGTITATNQIKLSNNQAGITGYGSGTNAVRFWAGGATPGSAPFRVTEGGELMATSGQIGNFKLSGGWLTCAGNPGQNVGFIDMKSGPTRIAFGQELVPPIARGGVTCTAIITNGKRAGTNGCAIGLNVNVWGTASENSHAVALETQGGVRIKGEYSLIEDLFKSLHQGVSTSDFSSAASLRYKRTFVFQPTTYTSIFLPSDTAIEKEFGRFSSGNSVVDHSVIVIRILVTRYATANINVQSLIPLIDRSGNAVRENNTVSYSNFDLAKGDFAELMYFNRSWYLIHLNR